MSDSVAVVWVGSLVVVAIVWLGLILWLFRRLRLRYAAVYESIGSPSLFWNNSMRNNWLFIKFLFGSQWQSLDDPQLSAVVRVMQCLFVVYVLGFIAFVVVFMTVGIKPD